MRQHCFIYGFWYKAKDIIIEYTEGEECFMTEHKKTTVSSQTHGISLENRSKMTVTGVMDVAGFSEEKVEIQTTMGRLTVKGKKLNVNTLNTDTGELKLTGEVRSMEYSDAHRGGGLFAGLFN